MGVLVYLIQIRRSRALIFVSVSEVELEKTVTINFIKRFPIPNFSQKPHLIMIILTLIFCPLLTLLFNSSFFFAATFSLFPQHIRIILLSFVDFFPCCYWTIFGLHDAGRIFYCFFLLFQVILSQIDLWRMLFWCAFYKLALFRFLELFLQKKIQSTNRFFLFNVKLI